jgi:cytoskeleton protein RodZ
MSSTPFGEHLKREREMRGVSLAEVSAATRISTRFLEAIENEHWDLLPGGVFNRGFIRSVARFLGLDEDSMVAEYALETKGRVDVGVVPDPPMEAPRDWKPIVVLAIALILILGSATFVYARYGSRIAARFHKSPTATTAVAATTAVDANVPAAVPNTGSNTGTAADPLELKVQTNKPVILTIVADGKTVLNQMVETGDARQFEARDALELTSSDSGGVVLELNGQLIPSFGQPGQPGSIKLTRNDLKTPAGDSH